LAQLSVPKRHAHPQQRQRSLGRSRQPHYLGIPWVNNNNDDSLCIAQQALVFAAAQRTQCKRNASTAPATTAFAVTQPAPSDDDHQSGTAIRLSLRGTHAFVERGRPYGLQLSVMDGLGDVPPPGLRGLCHVVADVSA